MKVILDTNILRSDPKLQSQRFKVLLDIVGRLGGSFAMPRIVFKEFEAVCRRELTSAVGEFNSSVSNVERFVLSQTTPVISTDVETEVAALVKNLSEVLDFKSLIEYQPGYLEETVRRAVNRIPPCSSSGEEFRDTLVWLTALDVADAEDDKTVVLISNDGAFHNGEVLRDELANECKNRGLEIKFFRDLSFFAKDHEDQLGFITAEWIDQNVPANSLGLMVEDEIEKIAQTRLLSFLDEDSRLNQEVEPTGYTNIFNNNVCLDDFFVNKLSDGSIRVEAAYSGEFEVECEVSVRSHYREGRFARPGTRSWKGNRSSGMYTFEVDVYIAAEIIVIDESVADIRIIDVG